MWPDDSGGWLSEWGPGTEQQSGGAVQGASLVTGSGDPAPGDDRWTGWLQSLLSTGVAYAIQRDAAENGLVQGRAPNGQPVYVNGAYAPAPLTSPAGMGPLLLIGGAVVLFVMLSKK